MPKLRIPTFRKAESHNSNVWKSQKLRNSNFCQRQNSQFQCLETPKFTIPMFGKGKVQNSNFGIAKIPNSNVWKSQNSLFQSLGKPKFTAPMLEKAKIKEFQCL